MFSGGKRPNYLKLRTNLRLCINRLKLMEKKKTEMALKARREIADYLKIAKDDRARIRVEHIVREDYLVEAMEIIEMFCDLLLARFGLIEKMKEMDPGLEESIATILWASPRLSADIPELREVTNQLTIKYGKEYCEACRSDKLEKTNEQVLHKMALISPPKKLIESYLVEIAKTYDVPFEPDPTAFEDPQPTANLIDIGFEGVDTYQGGKRGGGGKGGGGGGGGMAPLSPEHMFPPPVNPDMVGFGHPAGQGSAPPAGFMPPMGGPPPQQYPGQQPGQYPGQHPGQYPGQQPGQHPGQHPAGEYRPSPPLPQRGPVGGSVPPGATSYGDEKSQVGANTAPTQYPGEPSGPMQPPRPPHYDDVFGPPAAGLFPPGGAPPTLPQAPPAGHTSQPPPPNGGIPNLPSIPNNDLPGLPSVPSDSVSNGGGQGDIDFDDLTRRFEELKKKK